MTHEAQPPPSPSEEDLSCAFAIIWEWDLICMGQDRPPLAKIIAAHVRAQVEKATDDLQAEIDQLTVMGYESAEKLKLTRADLASSLARETVWQKDLAAERRYSKALRKALVGLVGVDDRKELEKMETIMRALPAPEADEIATINAIHALIRSAIDFAEREK